MKIDPVQEQAVTCRVRSASLSIKTTSFYFRISQFQNYITK